MAGGLLGAVARNRVAQDVGNRNQKSAVVFAERARNPGVHSEHPIGLVPAGDDHPHAADGAVRLSDAAPGSWGRRYR